MMIFLFFCAAHTVSTYSVNLGCSGRAIIRDGILIFIDFICYLIISEVPIKLQTMKSKEFNFDLFGRGLFRKKGNTLIRILLIVPVSSDIWRNPERCLMSVLFCEVILLCVTFDISWLSWLPKCKFSIQNLLLIKKLLQLQGTYKSAK